MSIDAFLSAALICVIGVLALLWNWKVLPWIERKLDAEYKEPHDG